MSFTKTFGGTTTTPSDLSYRAVSLTAANTVLVWPRFNYNQSGVTADIMGVTPDAGSRSFNLPDATLVGDGTTILMINLGSNSFVVNDSTGSSKGTVAATQAVYFYLKSNATAAGSWGAIQFAVGSAAVVAADLDGPGLQVLASELTTSWPNSAESSSPVTINTTNHRSELIDWTGAAGTFNLPAASGNSEFFFAVRNSGTGVVTLDPSGSETIDGLATKAVSVGETFTVICTGSKWLTIGNTLNYTASYTAISAAGSGSLTLSTGQQGFTIYKFTGAKTGNKTVVFPSAVGQFIVENATTGGSFTFNIQTAVGGVSIALTDGDTVTCYTDGTDFFILQENTAAAISDGHIALIAENFAL
tara:strand:+ start:7735 stop:8814 length:1080 start_codon:yes stop_codon:yes gene_type:complete